MSAKVLTAYCEEVKLLTSRLVYKKVYWHSIRCGARECLGRQLFYKLCNKR